MLLILGAVIAGAVFALNKRELDRVNAPKVEINPQKVVETKDVAFGQIVEITGSLDLTNAVSMEDKDNANVIKYFVPFREYGTNYVVEISKAKLRSDTQTFVGVATGLTQTEHENRIRNRLNRPVELSDQDRVELDAETIQILTDQTTNEFTSKTVLIRDGQVPRQEDVFASMLFWWVLAFLAAVTLARKSIFS